MLGVMRSKVMVVFAMILVTAIPLAGQVTPFVTNTIQCIPTGGNGVVTVGVTPDVPGAEVRTYFRRQGRGDYYWVPADAEGSGVFWSVLPVPEPDNMVADYYSAVVGPSGALLAQTPVATVPITDDCDVDLTDPQSDRSGDLLIADTVLGQRDMKVAWWQCEGITERLDANGDPRDDELCTVAAIIPWYTRPAYLVPLALLGGGAIYVLIDDDGPTDVSPSNP